MKSKSTSFDPNTVFKKAMTLHQAGRLQEAAVLYEQLIARIPKSPPQVLTCLGTVKLQLGKIEAGVQILEQSLRISPNQPEPLNNRGLGLMQLNRFVEARKSFDRAIALKPDYAEAYNNRGNSLFELEHIDEALASYAHAITLKPDYVEAYNNRGIVLTKLKRFDEALASYDRAITLKPDYAEAYNNRGTVFVELKRFDEALASCDRAITLNPDYANAYSNRGNTLFGLKRIDEALASYERAIVLNSDFATAYSNRGNALYELKRLDEALASYSHAIALKPDYAEAYKNQANTLFELKRLDEALASCDRAIALRTDYAEAYYNRGNILIELYRFDESLASLNKALAIKPDFPYALGLGLLCKMYCCNWDDIDTAFARIIRTIDLDQNSLTPFCGLMIPSDLAHQQHCAQSYVEDKYPASATPLWQGERYAHERIRVGYFSSDYKNHPVSHLIAQLIECHDRTRFEIIGFSFGPPTTDPWRQRLEKAFDRFIDVRTQTDRQIATMAREMEIDIAIDLNGHTQDARTGIFALRPVPIQVNYLGYPGTIAADYIDYLIADQVVVPEDHRPYYTEKVVCLPHSYLPNDSTKAISDRHFSRAELGLPEDAFVFCCFNNAYKITPVLFDIWMRLLNAVDGSVLWLSNLGATAIKSLRGEAEKRGVLPDRLVIAERMEKLEDHLARIRHADLFLDTFYYNAHTTASDALWAGLPVLTYMGDTFAGRVAASLLTAVGLPELITHGHAEYESLALKLATQPNQLAAVRQKLAGNITTQPLFDTLLLTKHIEAAYVEMYGRYQDDLAPDHIYVTH